MSQLKAYGIDIGKDELHVCEAIPNIPPKKYPITIIKLSNPKWWLDMPIESPALIVCEPTGTHYIKPIVEAMRQRDIEAQIWLVNNNVTQSVREIHISRAKTDKLDSQALAVVADMIVSGRPPQQCRPLNIANDELISILRLLVNEHRRQTKEETRVLNRLDQLAHGIFPACAIRKLPFMTAVRFGAVTPDEIHQLAWLPADERPQGLTGQHTQHLRKLADELPANIEIHPHTRQIIEGLVSQIGLIRTRQSDIADNITHVLNESYHKTAQLWRTIPYSHDVAIASYIVACGHSFTTAESFRNAMGNAPTTYQSGGVDTTGRPRGYKPARAFIQMQLLGFLRSDNPIKRYKDAGKSMASARRKLVDIHFGIIKSNTPYEER